MGVDPSEQIAAWAVGGTGVISAIVYLTVSAVKGALVTAVQHVAQRELEGFKAELQRASDRELAELNAQLASKLDANRNDFAREMAVVHHQLTAQAERFKTELSFEAEKRRQLAARRLDAFDAVYAVGLRAIHVLLRREGSDPLDALNAFYDVLREKSPLLTESFENDVAGIIADYKTAYDAKDWRPEGRTADEMRTVAAVHQRLSAVLRAEQAKRWDDIK